jgi:hypothetical protein
MFTSALSRASVIIEILCLPTFLFQLGDHLFQGITSQFLGELDCHHHNIPYFVFGMLVLATLVIRPDY